MQILCWCTTSDHVCLGPESHIAWSLAAYCGLSTVHEHIALPRQFLFLGRTVSESSKTDLHASFCGPPSCSDSGRLAIASPSTEQHVTQADQQHLHRRLATPPAAPRRKLPQCTFQINIPTACGSTAATPLPGGTSDPSPTLYQHVHNYYLQSEAGKAQSITTLGEQATQAASMSALLAHAEPISSVEHLLQRLQTRSTPPATVSSEQESSGNHGTSALSSCNLLDTGGSPFFSFFRSFFVPVVVHLSFFSHLTATRHVAMSLVAINCGGHGQTNARHCIALPTQCCISALPYT